MAMNGAIVEDDLSDTDDDPDDHGLVDDRLTPFVQFTRSVSNVCGRRLCFKCPAWDVIGAMMRAMAPVAGQFICWLWLFSVYANGWHRVGFLFALFLCGFITLGLSARQYITGGMSDFEDSCKLATIYWLAVSPLFWLDFVLAIADRAGLDHNASPFIRTVLLLLTVSYVLLLVFLFMTNSTRVVLRGYVKCTQKKRYTIISCILWVALWLFSLLIPMSARVSFGFRALATGTAVGGAVFGTMMAACHDYWTRLTGIVRAYATCGGVPAVLLLIVAVFSSTSNPAFGLRVYACVALGSGAPVCIAWLRLNELLTRESDSSGVIAVPKIDSM